MSKPKKKILIVDDSLVIQKLLTRYISLSNEMDVVAACSDPFQASEVLAEQEIDCMILDLELPKMDGVTFIKKLKKQSQVKIIVLSGMINQNPEAREKLLALGASEALPKPEGHNHDAFFKTLLAAIRSATETQESAAFSESDSIVVIASSTGSTDSVKRLVMALKEKSPTLVVIQHMAGDFTTKFAKSLDLVSEFTVQEIKDSMRLDQKSVYIAPGNFHVQLSSHLSKYSFHLSQAPHIHGVRPAADFTLNSWPAELAKKTTVIILSGMGRDGAQGLALLKDKGAYTIAESENTSVVFGMPKAAIETGKVDLILDLDEIIEWVATGEVKKKSA